MSNDPAQTPTKAGTSRRKLAARGCAISLLAITTIFCVTRLQAQRLIDKRIEKIDSRLKELLPTTLHRRKYPFPQSFEREASQYYRSLEALFTPKGTPLLFEPGNPESSDQGLWAESEDVLQLHANKLLHYLDSPDEWTTAPSADLKTALDFFHEKSDKILELLWAGVLSDHIQWRFHFNREGRIGTTNGQIHELALLVAILRASQLPAEQALEIQLMTICFGYEHALFPNSVNLHTGNRIRNIASRHIQRQIQSNLLNRKQLQRVITALGSLPNLPDNLDELDDIANDLELYHDLFSPSTRNPNENKPSFTADSLTEIVVQRWSRLEHYRREGRIIWKQPIQNIPLRARLEIKVRFLAAEGSAGEAGGGRISGYVADD